MKFGILAAKLSGKMGMSALVGPATALVFLLAGCSFGIASQQTPEAHWSDAIPQGFDFATVHSIDISLEVRVLLNGIPQAYEGDIGVYTPSSDGSGRYELLGSGATDSLGKASFPILVPTALDSLTIRPPVFGLFERVVAITPLTTSIKLTIAPNDPLPARSIPSARSLSSARLVQASGGAFFSDGVSSFKYLSDFDSEGVPIGPKGLQASPESFSLLFLKDITNALPENKPLPDSHPTYIDSTGRSNLSLTADTEVTVTFLYEGAGNLNSFGYFVYTTSEGPPPNPPAESEITIAFANTSLIGSGGGLQAGDRITLVNPADGSTTFKAGTTIVWVLFPYGYLGSRVNNHSPRFFSIPSYNPESGSITDRTHVAFLKYNKPAKHDKPLYILAFEDINRARADNDFNDVVFTVNTSRADQMAGIGVPEVSDAIDSDGDGVLDSLDAFPTESTRSATLSWPSATGYATAVFEDAWPYMGDYDFNDIVANFRATTTRNARGEAVETILEVRLRAAGGGLPSALALSLPVSSSEIAAVNGQKLYGRLFSPGPNGSEASGTNSVIPLFSDSHTEFGVAGSSSLLANTVPGAEARPEVPYSIVISYKSGVNASRLTETPDIFAVIGGDRGHEIHAIGKLPTAMASLALFGTAMDNSVAGTGPYYLGKNSAPWVLMVPSEIAWPTERSEISTAYLKFSDWVRSGGTDYADWWQSTSGYRNADALYK